MAIHAKSRRTPERRSLRGGDAPVTLLSTAQLLELLGAPQTAISEGDAPLPWCDFEGIKDLASLDLARQRYLRRRAADAVDYLIAMLDAIDAAIDDMEEDDAGGGDILDQPHDGDDDSEPTLGAPETHTDGAVRVAGCWFNLPADQRHWADGCCHDREQEVTDELHDDDTDLEPDLGAVAWDGTGDNWTRSSDPNCLQPNDRELVNEDGAQHAGEDALFAAIDFNAGLGADYELGKRAVKMREAAHV